MSVETITFADLLLRNEGDDIGLHAKRVQHAAMQAIFDKDYDTRYLQVFPTHKNLAEASPKEIGKWFGRFYEWLDILTPADRDRLANERVMVK